MRRPEDFTRLDMDNPAVYPDGKIKDATGINTNDGTRINEAIYGDVYQTMMRAARGARITPSGLPDNEANGYQLFDALTATNFVSSGGGINFNTQVGFYGASIDADYPLRYRYVLGGKFFQLKGMLRTRTGANFKRDLIGISVPRVNFFLSYQSEGVFPATLALGTISNWPHSILLEMEGVAQQFYKIKLFQEEKAEYKDASAGIFLDMLIPLANV